MTEFTQIFSVSSTGLKVAVKDCLDVQGFPTTGACRALADADAATQNADVVQHLVDAGCALVGKANMHELAFGMTGVNDWTGTPINTLFPDLITGGSSSGSAVLAAREEIDFTLGTDTGGSVRLPAACCGVYGFKPTFGRVSRKGAYPVESSLDCVGPLSSSIQMIIKAMEIIDPTFKASGSAESYKVGVVSATSMPKIEPEIQNAVYAFIQGMEDTVTSVQLPSLMTAFEAGMDIIGFETYKAFGHLLSSGKVGRDVAARLDKAGTLSELAIDLAEVVRERFNDEVDAAFEEVDILVLPTLPSFPMTRAEAMAGETDLMISALVRPFNISGHPAISIPLAPVEGRPVAVQLVGRKGEDEFLCEVARAMADAQSTNG